MSAVRPRIDFAEITPLIPDGVYQALVRIAQPMSCGLSNAHEDDVPVIAILLEMKLAGICFVTAERGGDFYELTALGRAYVIWRQRRVTP